MKDLLCPSLQLDLIMFDKYTNSKLSVQNEMCQAWLVGILGNHGKLQSRRKTIELKVKIEESKTKYWKKK